MQYKIVKQRVAVGKDAGREKYRILPLTSGTVTFEELVQQLEKVTAFSSGDIVGLVTALTDMLRFYLEQGYSVQMGDLGNFRLTFGSKGFDAPRKFVAQRDIRNVRVSYLPSKKLKQFELNFERAEDNVQ